MKRSKRVAIGAFLWFALGASLSFGESGELAGELLKQERLGYYYFSRGDVGGALSYLRPVAESGHALSQYRVGSLEEAATNFDEARSWYERAIEGGVWEASHALAGMYANGLLGPQNLKKAYELELPAAEAGFLPSMNYVANALERGLGVVADVEGGLAWYRRAADSGSTIALQRLLAAVKKGELGQPADEVKAKELQDRLAQALAAEEEARREFRKAAYDAAREIEKRYLNREG